MLERLLPMVVVMDRVGLSKTTIYRLINDKTFPKPRRIGRQKIAFVESEINAWIAERIEGADDRVAAERRRARAIHAVGGRS